MFLVDFGVEVELGEGAEFHDDALVSEGAALVDVHVLREDEQRAILNSHLLQLSLELLDLLVQGRQLLFKLLILHFELVNDVPHG